MYHFPHSVSIADASLASCHNKPGHCAHADALPRQLIAATLLLLLSAAAVPYALAVVPTVKSLIRPGQAPTRPNVSDSGLRAASEAVPLSAARYDFATRHPSAARFDGAAHREADTGASLSAGLSPRGCPGIYFIGRLN